MGFLKRIFPFLDWFKDLDAAGWRADFISGVTVALVLVPQSMAYAQLAGLPPYYGLYAAFLPPMVANLFGSSRQLATGPVAVVSLMTSAALEPLATAGGQQYIAYAILLALMVGIFQFLLGVLRLGLVVNFLSHPVVNGFTNAAALIIATSQLSKIFGVYVDKAAHHYETVWRVIVEAVSYTHLPTLGMAALAFATMIGLKRIDRRIPNVLVAVVATTLLAWATGFEKNEKIALSQIRSQSVAELVGDFNHSVLEKTTLEEFRADVNKTFSGPEFQEKQYCLRCHGPRDIASFHGDAGEEYRLTAENVLALHHMAGLVDGYIVEMKGHASDYRTELRDLFFERVPGPDGAAVFYVRGEVPEGRESDRGKWRIKVGNRTLDESQLTMMGGGAVVGLIPKGLPEVKLPTVDVTIIPKLLAAAIIISILGFMEAISIAKAMAAKTRQKLDPNQELIGQGLANMVGCMSQSYAVSGSFSRSAVNLQAGGRTGMSNVFSSIVVGIVLLFFAGLLYHLPQATLAAIIMMAVFGLLNVSGFVAAWRAQKFDGIVSLVAFVGTLGFAPHLEWGLMLGVMLSLGGYLFRTMRPHVAELSIHSDGSLKDARRHGLDTCRYLAAVRFDGPLNFASTAYLEEEVQGRVAEMPELRHLIIAAHGINEIDASGEEMLRHLLERMRTSGYEISFSGLKDEVLDVLKRSHLYEIIGEDHMYPTQRQAVAAIYPQVHIGTEESECPFVDVMPKVTEISLHQDGSLRDAARHRLPLCQHIAALRFDAPLNFANTSFLEEHVVARLEGRTELRHVVFVAHGISDIDAAGAQKLGQLVTRLRTAGFDVSFSGFKDEVLDVLRHGGIYELIGESHMHPTQVLALGGTYARAHLDSVETECPFESLAPHLTELSLHPDGSLRDAQRHGLELCRYVGALRFEGPFILANPEAIQADFERWAAGRQEVHYLLLVASGLTKLDASGGQRLLGVVRFLRDRGYEVVFSSFPDQVYEELGRTGVADEIGLDRIYPIESLALAGISARAHESMPEERCPLSPMLPRVTELSLHPDGSLRDAQRHGLRQCRFLAAIRFDGSLDFATIGYFEEQLTHRLKERPELRLLLIVAHGMSRLDAIAAEELCQLIGRMAREGRDVYFSGLKDEVLDVLQQTGAYEVIGEDHMFPTQVMAVAGLWARAHDGSDEEDCPLRSLAPRLVELSLHPDGSLRDAERRGLRLCRHVAVLRFDAPLTALNMAFLEDEILRRLSGRPTLRHVIFVTDGVGDIDVTGAEKLGELVKRLRADGIDVSFSGLKDEVLDVLGRTGLETLIGEDHMYATHVLAVAGVYVQAHEGSTESDCPFTDLAPRLTELSLHPDGSLRDAQVHSLELCPTIAVLRFDGPFIFANPAAIEDQFARWRRRRPEVKQVLFVSHTISELRGPEPQRLLSFVRYLRELGYEVFFSSFLDHVFETIGRGGVADEIGLDHCYPIETVAMAGIFAASHHSAAHLQCPLSAMLPRVFDLSLHPDGSLRDVHRFKLEQCRHIAAIRFEGPLNFGTAGYFREEMLTRLENRPELRHVLLVAHTLTSIDALGAEELSLLVSKLRNDGADVSLSGVKDEVLDVLERTGSLAAIGEQAFYPTQAKAVEVIHEKAHEGSSETPCPLLEVVYLNDSA